MAQVVTEIGGSSFVLLVDDFQYMHREVQGEVAKTLKTGGSTGRKDLHRDSGTPRG